MPQSVFISYVYEDQKHRDSVEHWFANNLVGPNRVTIAESGDFRHLGASAIESHLKPKIRGAGAVLCLIGDNSHNSDWVQYELDVATSLNKKILLARIPGTHGGPPPRHRHLKIHALDPSLLRKLL